MPEESNFVNTLTCCGRTFHVGVFHPFLSLTLEVFYSLVFLNCLFPSLLSYSQILK